MRHVHSTDASVQEDGVDTKWEISASTLPLLAARLPAQRDMDRDHPK